MGIAVFRAYIKRKDMDTVLSCLLTDSMGPGEYLDRFQKSAKEVFDFEYGTALRSPYFAFGMALDLYGLESGDSVAISALSPSWYVTVLKDRNLEPVFLDVSAETANPSKVNFEHAFSAAESKPSVLVWGGGVGILPATGFFDELGIPVIEDFTRSLGGTRQGIPARSMGKASFISLEHGSALTAGGGALLYAQEKRESAVIKNAAESLPLELLMTDYNAALGFSQLRELERGVAKRREIRQMFNQSLAGGRHRGFLQEGEAEAGCWTFPVVIESSSKDVMAYSKKKDIDTEYAFAGSCSATGLVPSGSCPVARSLSLRTLIFPLHQRIGASGAQRISRVLATLP